MEFNIVALLSENCNEYSKMSCDSRVWLKVIH